MPPLLHHRGVLHHGNKDMPYFKSQAKDGLGTVLHEQQPGVQYCTSSNTNALASKCQNSWSWQSCENREQLQPGRGCSSDQKHHHKSQGRHDCNGIHHQQCQHQLQQTLLTLLTKTTNCMHTGCLAANTNRKCLVQTLTSLVVLNEPLV